MRINHNIAALNTYRQLTIGGNNASKAMEKLSSGLRINKAGDDAAGLAISEKMRGQIKGLEMASKNAQDGISFIQTAEGALNETHSILQRMRELAVQSANDTNTDADRAELQKEVDQLAQELTRIANNTEFNTKSLLNGAVSDSTVKAAYFHIGANSNQSLVVSINAMDAFSLGVARDVRDVSTLEANVNGGRISNLVLDSEDESLGAAVVDGATIRFDGAEVPGVSGAPATGQLVVDTEGTPFTIKATFGTDGEAGNGINIVFGEDNDDELAATWEDSTSTVTVRGDWNNSASKAPSDLSAIESIIQSADTSLSSLTLQVIDGSLDIGKLGNTGPLTLDGGTTEAMSDAVTVTVSTTLEGAYHEYIITVASDATHVSIDSGVFAGISFDVVELANLDPDEDYLEVTGSTVRAQAATFADGVKEEDAVAAGGIDISSQAAADSAITVIQNAIETVSAERSKLGAYQNRLEHTIANLGTSSENLTAAESRIRDVDMAKEMMEFTKSSILTQAAQAMLAQANQQPQGVLQLLR